jgi:LuxR family transcriptional regulator, maltose regulon positive regulatory protein
MVEEVDRSLARAVGGPAAETLMTPAAAGETFVELRDDLSFRCAPLLRAAAAAELAREPLEVRRAATRRVAQWHIDHDRAATGVEIGVAAEDWPWVARALVQSYVVPQILSGGVTKAVGSALEAPSVRAAEPSIEAALGLRSGGPDAAEAALSALDSRAASGEDAAGEFSAICVRLAAARARGDVSNGMLIAEQARQWLPRLPIERHRELVAFVEAHVGALALCNGQLTRAEAALRRGAHTASDKDRGPTAVLDCSGQLALLEAFQGNLRSAELQAAAVLRKADAAAFASRAHAHLAAAWVHVARAEHVLARQHLDRAADAATDAAEPWVRTVHLLAEVRLLIAADQPEAALRLLRPAVEACSAEGPPGWAVALLTLATAEALVASGEPLGALELVVPGSAATPVANGVVAARALVALGDVSGARKALAAVSSDLAGAPLDVQVEHWLLEARLAEEAGTSDRARLLVGRALRASGREQLRRLSARESTWLVPLVERDVSLRREHGGFLARLTTAPAGRPVRVPVQRGPAPMLVETLTAREAQVLGLLAQMCSTEEIAQELFLSVNTVKTHVRGILRKFSVNRRIDAVRRSHELGLC